MTNQDLSTAACLAMHATADLPHRAHESVLYPRLAESDVQAVEVCVPWLRERGYRVTVGDSVDEHDNPRAVAVAKKISEPHDANTRIKFGETWAIALCRMVLAVAESEAQP